MSRYGKPSRKMLSFLFENPGSTAREVTDYLFDGRTVEQVLVQYRYSSREVDHGIRTQWQAKRYVLEHMMNSKWYEDVKILEERIQLLSKICRGKFSYLTSPYCSRTLAADTAGASTHRAAANKTSQRRWWYRRKDDKNIYRYFLTLKGLADLKEHGLK